MKKAERCRQTSDAVMPRISRTRFLSRRNSPKFLSREKNLSKLSAFFCFCPDHFVARRIFAGEGTKTSGLFRLFSCQKSVKNEKSGDFSSLFRELSSRRSKNNFEFNSTKLLNFYVSGAETCRSRFSKTYSPDGQSRRVSADNPYYQDWRTVRPTDFSLTASCYARRSRSIFRLSVSNSESRLLSPKKISFALPAANS
jgi:hypothetical protein